MGVTVCRSGAQATAAVSGPAHAKSVRVVLADAQDLIQAWFHFLQGVILP